MNIELAMTNDVIPIHIHSEYSMLDGAINIAALVKHLKAEGYTHAALTDHGNMHGAIEFYLEAKKNGITPILGCEIYCKGLPSTHKVFKDAKKTIPESFHLVLLAKNISGYKNLLKIVSQGFLGENLSEIPIVPMSTLKEFGKDLIVLSACLKGEFAALLEILSENSAKNSPLDRATLNDPLNLCAIALKEHVEFMKSALDEGSYYVELIDNNIPQQKLMLPMLVDAAEFFGLPIVATSDAHYLKKEFANTHTLTLAMKNGLTMGELRGRLRNTSFHLLSKDEMRSRFHRWPEALANTKVIAEACGGLSLKMDTYYLPKISLADGETPKEGLRRLATKGLEERFLEFAKASIELSPEKKTEYVKRLSYEIEMIIQMGFPDYFLIVQDFINWAKSQGIPVGPGRGSGAGSLVAFALRITNIDPLPYNLIFERFLNPERVSMPDFDVDFCQWRREEVIQYCIKKYGTQCVAQITTFGKMQAKAAVKSVGRALNLNYGRVDQFSKLIPNEIGITIKDALGKEPRLHELMNKDDELKECVNYAMEIEGLIAHSSVHAAGLVISDGPMSDYVPIYTTDGKALITQYEMKPVEKVGLVKFDFLGLKTLTVIDLASKLLKESINPTFNIDLIPLADTQVYDMLSQGHTCGVFQCEGGGITQLILKLKPSTFEDIIALVALFRPGPLGSGMVDDFVERKHGRQKIAYAHPNLESILKDTYGMILYQEQVQKIAAVLANYSLGEADLLRRAMGKKIPEEMAKQKGRFVSGAEQNQIPKELAEEIFDLMAEFANYGFNKSHSAAYGLVSYQTAYLKAHYPEHFLAASMSCDLDNTDKIVRYAEECRKFHIALLPPCINRSGVLFGVKGKGQIDFALSAIKGVGQAVLGALIENRKKHGPFANLLDLATRVHLGHMGKKTLQLLGNCGAFDVFGYSRSQLFEMIPDLVDFSVTHHEAKASSQKSLFEMDVDHHPQNTTLVQPQKTGQNIWNLRDLFAEKELTGVFLSAHPLKYFRHDIAAFSKNHICDFESLLKKEESKSPPPLKKNDDEPKSFFRTRVKVTFVALLTKIDQRRTKTSGKILIACTLEQEDAVIEGVFFESQAKNQIHFPEVNSVVLACGSIERGRDGEGCRLVLERFFSLDEIRHERLKGLHLKFQEPVSADILDSLTKLSHEHQGRWAVAMTLNLSSGARLELSTPRGVSTQFLDALQGVPASPHWSWEYRF